MAYSAKKNLFVFISNRVDALQIHRCPGGGVDCKVSNLETGTNGKTGGIQIVGEILAIHTGEAVRFFHVPDYKTLTLLPCVRESTSGVGASVGLTYLNYLDRHLLTINREMYLSNGYSLFSPNCRFDTKVRGELRVVSESMSQLFYEPSSNYVLRITGNVEDGIAHQYYNKLAVEAFWLTPEGPGGYKYTNRYLKQFKARNTTYVGNPSLRYGGTIASRYGNFVVFASDRNPGPVSGNIDMRYFGFMEPK